MIQKLLTKEEKKKRNQRNQLIVGIILIGIMILSTLGYALNSDTNSESSTEIVDYNGVKFTKSSDYWYFNYQNNEFMTRYSPKEIEDIKFSSFITLQNYANKPLYFVGNSGDSVYEISRNIDSRFVMRSQMACISSLNCTEDLPIKNCSDNVIIIREPSANEKERIYQENNCVFIISKAENQTRFADVFLYKTLGIK
jgi:hypothetical protein